MGCAQGKANDGCYEVQNFCKINGQKVEDNLSIDARSLSSITANTTIYTTNIQNRIYTVLKNIYDYGNRGTRNPYITNGDYDESYNLETDFGNARETEIIINIPGGVRAFEFTNGNNGQVLYLQVKGQDGEGSVVASGGRYSYAYPQVITRIRIPRNESWQNWFNIRGNITLYHEGNFKFSDVNKGNTIYQSLYNQIIDFIDTTKEISDQPIIQKELMDELQSLINNYELEFDRCNTCNTACNSSCQADWQCGCCDDGQQHCEDQWDTGCSEPGHCSSACSEGYPMACTQYGW